jgi:hypothetical protein
MAEPIEAKKRKLKKAILIIAVVFAALLVLLLISYGVLELIKGSGDVSALTSDHFYSADYNEDITKDEVYQSKMRGVSYLEYGTGEMITEENLESMPDSAKFFYEYFNCVISGDYTGYKSFFTQDYLEDNRIPDKFTKQKIYDIEVNLYSRQNIEQDGKSIIVDTFIVKYKIYENNGTFRNDVGSNTIVPLVFQLYKQNGSVLINNISSMIYK